jgi:hypothetical protein
MHPYQDLIKAIIVANPDGKSGAHAAILVDQLEQAQRQRERWVVAEIRAMLIDTAQRDIANEMNYQQGLATVYTTQGDKQYAIPAMIGQRGRRSDGTTEKWYQRSLWIDLSRDDALAIALRDQATSDVHRDKVAAYNRYFEIWDRYPQAQSAREACQLAGVDPYNILPAAQQGI